MWSLGERLVGDLFCYTAGSNWNWNPGFLVLKPFASNFPCSQGKCKHLALYGM